MRELLKQKLSTLHASSTVRICRLLCTVTLEMHVLTNNLGYRRSMNIRLPLYLMDSPVGLRPVLLVNDSSQRFLQCGYKLTVKVNKQKNNDTENLIYN